MANDWSPTDGVRLDIVKGTRIRAQWIDAEVVGLAGVQMKFGATSREVTGVVRHIYGLTADVPEWLYVDPDDAWDGPTVTDCSCGGPHVRVRPRHVVEILRAREERW